MGFMIYSDGWCIIITVNCSTSPELPLQLLPPCKTTSPVIVTHANQCLKSPSSMFQCNCSSMAGPPVLLCGNGGCPSHKHLRAICDVANVARNRWRPCWWPRCRRTASPCPGWTSWRRTAPPRAAATASAGQPVEWVHDGCVNENTKRLG